jgi:hypothetical protein
MNFIALSLFSLDRFRSARLEFTTLFGQAKGTNDSPLMSRQAERR